jgi:outer membrane receptor protein involved in Fe transport
MWSVEAGLKSLLADNTLRLNASVFYSRRDDQQVRTSFQLVAGDPASFGFATLNVDGGNMTGVEGDLRWFPNDSWELYANVGLLNARLGDFPTSVGGPSDRGQAHAPRYTLAAGATYRGARGYYARLDLTARDEFYFDVSHDQRSSAYELVHARVGYEGDSWSAQLWARNLFDKHYAVRGFYFGNEPPDFPNKLYTRLGDPRHVGITIEKRFD